MKTACETVFRRQRPSTDSMVIAIRGQRGGLVTRSPNFAGLVPTPRPDWGSTTWLGLAGTILGFAR
jgi:hypothetical protein